MSSKQGVRWAFNFTKWNPSYNDMLLATSCIQPEEKTRLGRFVFKKDFKSSLIGRLMMRKFISQSTSTPYNEINLLRDEKGKPYTAHQNLNFNVSHQGDYAVLAGESSSSLLGIDVMKLEYTGGKNLKEFFRLMDKQFSSYEWNCIRSFPSDSEQIAMFCRHWCLKESYVKAIGVGITVDLKQISFKINSPLSKSSLTTDTELYFQNQKMEDWLFEEILINDDHCVAVALNTDNLQSIQFRELSFEELVDGAKPLIDMDRVYVDEYFRKLDKA